MDLWWLSRSPGVMEVTSFCLFQKEKKKKKAQSREIVWSQFCQVSDTIKVKSSFKPGFTKAWVRVSTWSFCPFSPSPCLHIEHAEC